MERSRLQHEGQSEGGDHEEDADRPTTDAQDWRYLFYYYIFFVAKISRWKLMELGKIRKLFGLLQLSIGLYIICLEF